MILSRNVILPIGLAVIISLFITNDNTIPYFIIVFLSLLSLYLLYLKKIKTVFVLSSIILVLYSYMAGLLCRYIYHADFADSVSNDRALGYAGLASLPFVFLSLLSISFIYEYLNTMKINWYIGFVCLIVLSSIGAYEGYGTNYLFKIVIIGLNLVSFNQLNKVTTN